MRKFLVLASLASLATFAAAPAVRADDMDHAHMHGGAAAPSALDPFKKLEGTWTGKAGAGDQAFDASVTYKVTAAGSAVVETMFPGSPHEMVTVYTVENGALALTHYCAYGNQPHLRARKADAGEVDFEFAGGPGIDPRKDGHMHAAKFRFPDADHMVIDWTDWKDGKAAGTKHLDLARSR